MKKAYIALLSVASLLASCQAEPQTAEPSTGVDTADRIVITASTQVDSKVDFAEDTDQITLAWADGDAFTIYDQSGARVGDLVYVGEEGATTGDFIDNFDSDATLVDGQTYTAVMPASDCATLDERNAALESSITTQTIDSVESLDYLNDIVSMNTSFTYSEQESNTITFSHERSLIHLNLAMDIGVTPSSIEVCDGGNGDALYTVSLPADCPRSISIYIAVEPREVTEAVDITFDIDDTYTKTFSSAVNLVAGQYHEVTISFVSVGWTKDYVNDLSIPAAGNATLAVMGDKLIVSTCSAQYIVDIETGAAEGEASWSMDLGTYGAITSDDAGNLLLASGAAAGETYTVYSTTAIDVAPTELISLSNPYGVSFGKKISVYGDITSDAIITAPLWYGANADGFMFVRWVVSAGVVGEAEKITVAGVKPDSWNGNMDVCYASTDASSGTYYTAAYSANEINEVSSADNTLLGCVSGTLMDTSFNVSCVDAVEVEGSKYVATLAGAHFTYGGTPTVYLYDVTSLASYPAQVAFTVTTARYNSGSGASGDILLEASGSNINMFFIDGYDGTIAYYQYTPGN